MARGDATVTGEHGRAEVVVVSTREELEIAAEVRGVLEGAS
jgi:hypothetical protein